MNNSILSKIKFIKLIVVVLLCFHYSKSSNTNQSDYSFLQNYSYELNDVDLNIRKTATKLNKNLYHMTNTIFSNLRDLASGSCKGKLFEEEFSKSTTKKEFKNINNYDLSQYDGIFSLFKLSNFSSTKDKLKVFIIAGEHARELISVELAYYFINFLCGSNKLSE
jgi:hypothetical protein